MGKAFLAEGAKILGQGDGVLEADRGQGAGSPWSQGPEGRELSRALWAKKIIGASYEQQGAAIDEF